MGCTRREAIVGKVVVVSRAVAIRAVASVLVMIAVACGRGTVAPLQNTTEQPMHDEPVVDEAEWRYLHAVAKDRPDGLSELAAFYQRHAAWDEYSVVRAAMLDRAVMREGPAPGGPFPRVGAPRPSGAAPPRTVLSRWLDRAVLPELYVAEEPMLAALEQTFTEAVAAATPAYEASRRVRLADLLCVRFRFSEAATHYEAALGARQPPADAARVRARAHDVRRILLPGADNIADQPEQAAPP